MTLFYRNRFFKRAIIILVALMVIYPLGTSLTKSPPIEASDWAGWTAINTIYFNTSQDDPTNHFLQTAANELQDYLGQMAGRSFTITHTYPPAPAIYLAVDAAMLSGHNDEASRLVINNNGVTITGKTAIAVREGAYLFLNSLGVYWLMRNDIWTVVPTSLPSLTASDTISEPYYTWRRNWCPNTYGWDNLNLWRKRNLMGGAASYFTIQNYYAIMPGSLYSTYPGAYLPEGNDPDGRYSDWQLKPDNADVISHAESYALTYLANNPHNDYIDTVPRYVVPISPNDGSGWGSYLTDSNDESQRQTLTDKVNTLTNTVANYIQSFYPGYYAGVFSDNFYSELPTDHYTAPVYVELGTYYSITGLTTQQRIEGIFDLGGKVGVYEFWDEYAFYGEDPPSMYYPNGLETLENIKNYADWGATVYTSEGGDCDGAWGIGRWVAAQLQWNPEQSVSDLIHKFCVLAFGEDAAVPMERYYYRYLNGLPADDNSLALAFRDMAEAETLAEGNEDVLARIRFMEYYLRFLWKSQSIDTMSKADLEDLYVLVTKLRDVYVIWYGSTNFGMDDGDRERVSDELVSRFPETYPDDATVIAALSDYTPPTTQEAATWLTEALTYFENEEGCDAPYVGWENLTLVALGDNSTENLTPTTDWRQTEWLVRASEGESIQLNVRGSYSYSHTYYLKDLEDNVLDSSVIVGDGQWHSDSVSFTAPYTGQFRVVGDLSGDCEVINQPCALINEHIRTQSTTVYFYVPVGTPSIVVELHNSNNGTKLYDPEGNLVATIDANGYGGINSPASGLWKLDFKGDSVSGSSYFKIFGVPDLTSYRPQYLLVEGTDTPAPPVLNSIGNKSAHPGMPLQFTVSATDPNGDALTYAASNLPSWASFNTATRTFSGTPDQTGNYTGVHFEVSDGALTDSEDITIAVTTNHAPTLVNPGNKSVNEGTVLSFTISATDPDSDPLNYSASNMPSGSSFSQATRTFSWTPSYTQAGAYPDIRFSVTDGQLSSSQNITITVNNVNRPPVLNPIGNRSVTTDQLLTFTVSATDPDGDSLTYSATNLPGGASFNSSTRVFSWTPVAGQEGSHPNIRFSATDAALTATVTITITVNRNPDIDHDGAVNIYDLFRVIQHWGETGSNGWIVEDVNSDGKINVLDIIVISQHWTG
jgi:hypothetical protein